MTQLEPTARVCMEHNFEFIYTSHNQRSFSKSKKILPLIKFLENRSLKTDPDHIRCNRHACYTDPSEYTRLDHGPLTAQLTVK